MDEFNEANIPEQYKPETLWQFVGLLVLSAIPCVGLIVTIIFACGAIKNKNIVNYARAQLVLIGIVLAIYLLLMILGVGAGFMSGIMNNVRY